MDARIAALLVAHQNANDLPYYLAHPTTNQPISAHFQATASTDLAQVRAWPNCAAGWQPGCSTFYDVWIGCIGATNRPTLKLKVVSDRRGEVQGLLCLDPSTPCLSPSERLLEAAPHNQSGSNSQQYKRAGTTLVVRMVLECYLHGVETLYLRTHPRNVKFYTDLKFEPSGRARGYLYLTREKAQVLLTNYFFGTQNEA